MAIKFLTDIDLIGDINVSNDVIANSFQGDWLTYNNSDAINWNIAFGWGDHASVGYELLSNKNQINGYAGLDGAGKIPTSLLPDLAITQTYVATNEANMLALNAQQGDVAVRTDVNETYILAGTNPAVLADWQKMLTPTDAVNTVNGLAGNVQLDLSFNSGDLSLTGSGGVIDLDARYPLINHTHSISDVINLQTSLDNKLSLSGGTVTGITNFVKILPTEVLIGKSNPEFNEKLGITQNITTTGISLLSMLDGTKTSGNTTDQTFAQLNRIIYNSSNETFGLKGSENIARSTGSGNITYLYGSDNKAEHTGSGTLGFLSGVIGRASILGTGIVDNDYIRAFDANAKIDNPNSTVEFLQGMHITAAVLNGTVTNAYVNYLDFDYNPANSATTSLTNLYYIFANDDVRPTISGDAFFIKSNVTLPSEFAGSIQATSLIKTGGTSSEILMADGSITNVSAYQPSGSYDNYQSWNLRTAGVQRTTIQSGGIADFRAGTDMTVGYSAGGVVTYGLGSNVALKNVNNFFTTTQNISGSLNATSQVSAQSFTDGFILWTGAQINRNNGAVELQFNPDASSEDVRIFGNKTYSTIFDGGTGAVSINSTLNVLGISTFAGISAHNSYILNKNTPVNMSYGQGGSDSVLFDWTHYSDKRYTTVNAPNESNGFSASDFKYSTNHPFAGGSILETSAFKAFYSDFIPVVPGEELYGEMYAKYISGSGGVLYYGIERYDSEKRPIAINQGTIYFVASANDVSSTSWTKYSGYTTLPTTHTPYNNGTSTSNGGGVYYVRIRILMNHSTGGALRQFGGIMLKRTSINHNLNVSGIITGNGSGLGNVNATTLDSLDSLDFVRSTGNVTQTITGAKSFSVRPEAPYYIANNHNSITNEYTTIAYQFSEGRGWGYNNIDDAVFYNGANGNIPFILTPNLLKLNAPLNVTETATFGDNVNIGTSTTDKILRIFKQNTGNFIELYRSGANVANIGASSQGIRLSSLDGGFITFNAEANNVTTQINDTNSLAFDVNGTTGLTRALKGLNVTGDINLTGNIIGGSQYKFIDDTVRLVRSGSNLSYIATNHIFTGSANFGSALTVSGTSNFNNDVTLNSPFPRFNLYSTDIGEDDWSIINNNGTFGIYNTTDALYYLTISNSGVITGNGSGLTNVNSYLLNSLSSSDFVRNLNTINTSNAIKTFGNVEGITISTNTTASTGFPFEFGISVDFSSGFGTTNSSYNRDFTLFKATSGEKWYLSGYDATGNRLSWREIYHSGNSNLSTVNWTSKWTYTDRIYYNLNNNQGIAFDNVSTILIAGGNNIVFNGTDLFSFIDNQQGLGRTSNRWKHLYAGFGDFSGNVNATSFSGNGSGLTNLNADNVATGTIGDARLSSNVARLNTSNNQNFGTGFALFGGDIRGTSTDWTTYQIAQGDFDHVFNTRTNVGANLERLRITGGFINGLVSITNADLTVSGTIIANDNLQVSNRVESNYIGDVSADGGFNVKRTLPSTRNAVTGVGSGNARGWMDATIWDNNTNGLSYAGLDLNITFDGGSYGHYTGLQSRPSILNGATITDIEGSYIYGSNMSGNSSVTNWLSYVADKPFIFDNSTITNFVGLEIRAGAGTNGATITNFYGIRTLTGTITATNKWLIYNTDSSLPSRHDGNFTAGSFIKTSGLSTQFLKADGSVDSSTYQKEGEFNYTDTASTSYTISSSDKGQVKGFTGSTAITVTINQTSLTNVGDITYIDQMGTGEITFATGTGTINLRYNSSRTNKTDGQYSRVAIHKISSTDYRIFGELKSA